MVQAGVDHSGWNLEHFGNFSDGKVMIIAQHDRDAMFAIQAVNRPPQLGIRFAFHRFIFRVSLPALQVEQTLQDLLQSPTAFEALLTGTAYVNSDTEQPGPER